MAKKDKKNKKGKKGKKLQENVVQENAAVTENGGPLIWNGTGKEFEAEVRGFPAAKNEPVDHWYQLGEHKVRARINPPTADGKAGRRNLSIDGKVRLTWAAAKALIDDGDTPKGSDTSKATGPTADQLDAIYKKKDLKKYLFLHVETAEDEKVVKKAIKDLDKKATGVAINAVLMQELHKTPEDINRIFEALSR